VDLSVSPISEYTAPMTVPCSRLIGVSATVRRHPLPPDPHTAISMPTNGAVVSKRMFIDVIATATSPSPGLWSGTPVGIANDRLAGVATLTPVGWLLYWDAGDVPDGVYVLQSVAYDSTGSTSRSKGVTVVISHQAVEPSSLDGGPPTTGNRRGAGPTATT